MQEIMNIIILIKKHDTPNKSTLYRVCVSELEWKRWPKK